MLIFNSDWDCSGNGICRNSTCLCNKQWYGSRCNIDSVQYQSELVKKQYVLDSNSDCYELVVDYNKTKIDQTLATYKYITGDINYMNNGMSR